MRDFYRALLAKTDEKKNKKGESMERAAAAATRRITITNPIPYGVIERHEVHSQRLALRD